MFGEIVHDLSPKIILEKVSEFEIFKFYCTPFNRVGLNFCSELRVDNEASCGIKIMPSGKVLYRDFARGYSLNCFQYVCQKYKVKFDEALLIIATDFRIKDLPKLDVTPYEAIGIPSVKNNSIIESNKVIKIKKREWDKNSLKYWERYHFTIEDLIEGEVYPIQKYWIGVGETLYSPYDWTNDDPAYSYEEFGNGKRKILRPYSKEKKYKWTNNLNNSYIHGLKQLNDDKSLLIVTKAKKDQMMYRKLGYNAIASAVSETAGFVDSFIIPLFNEYERVLINYDNDEPGILASSKISNFYMREEIFIPMEYRTKDVSDTAEKLGLGMCETIIRKMINNGII